MMSRNRRYLFQVVTAANGARSEPFVADPIELKDRLASTLTEEEQNSMYVLVLADVGLEIKPQDFVSRIPLYRVSTWIELDLENIFTTIEGVSQNV